MKRLLRILALPFVIPFLLIYSVVLCFFVAQDDRQSSVTEEWVGEKSEQL